MSCQTPRCSSLAGRGQSSTAGPLRFQPCLLAAAPGTPMSGEILRLIGRTTSGIHRTAPTYDSLSWVVLPRLRRIFSAHGLAAGDSAAR